MSEELLATSTTANSSYGKHVPVTHASASSVWSGLFDLLSSSPVTLTVVVLTLIASWSSSLDSVFELHLQGRFGVVQILGCHLLHWSGEHLFWDLGMFAVLGIACERSHRNVYALSLLACALVIPLSVMLVNPAIDSYRGLSGIDTGIFSLLVASRLVRGFNQKDTVNGVVFGLLFLLLWCKIGFEFYSGQVLFVQRVDFVPLPIAHAIGALIGSAFSFCSRNTSFIDGTY